MNRVSLASLKHSRNIAAALVFAGGAGLAIAPCAWAQPAERFDNFQMRKAVPTQLKEVGPGLYFLYDDISSNSVFLVTDDGVLVVDTRQHPAHGTGLPGVDFLHLADHPGVDRLDGRAVRLVGLDLVAHLRHHPVLFRRQAHLAGLVDGVGERLLAEHVLLELHGRQGDRGVHVVRGSDHYRIEVLALALEHLAIVLVLLRVRILREPASGPLFVHIAHSHNVLGSRGADQNGGPANSHTDGGDIELLVRRLIAQLRE